MNGRIANIRGNLRQAESTGSELAETDWRRLVEIFLDAADKSSRWRKINLVRLKFLLAIVLHEVISDVNITDF